MAQLLRENLKLGRTMAFYAASDERIEELEPAGVNAALRSLIEPDRLVTVMAGDFEKVAREAAKSDVELNESLSEDDQADEPANNPE